MRNSTTGVKHFFNYFWSFTLLFLPAIVFAADTSATYTLTAPFSGELAGPISLSTYLRGVVQALIGIAGILAVIMLVYCGIQLMGTPSASGKSAAKECIWNAIFGVLLAIGAWILLYTVNPLLLSSELRLGNVTTAPAASAPNGPATDPYPTRPGWYFKYSDPSGIHYNPAGNSAETCAALLGPAAVAGKVVIEVEGQRCFEVLSQGISVSQGELSVRNALCGNNSCVGSRPISINVGPCPNVGAKGCTNVGGLPSESVNAILALNAACGCPVIISGGTEYWLHGNRSLTPPNTDSAHGPGNNVFDLKENAQLNALIKTGTQRGSFKRYERWLYNGFWYTEEGGDHWHACKDGLSASYCRS